MFCRKALHYISKSLKNSREMPNSLNNLIASLWRSSQSSYSTGSPLTLHRLKSRGLVELRGKDTVEFLQGLVSSDVTLLKGDNPAQYSMMLNVQGRVLYDLILYSTRGRTGSQATTTTMEEDVCVLVECDHSVEDELIKTIKRYKIRKKVAIRPVGQEVAVYAALSHGSNIDAVHLVQQLPETVVVPDPRVPSFGWRLLLPPASSDLKVDGVLKEESVYHIRRYEWGIAECTVDLPPGKCFPLESNLVLQNGVSFQKGCYIGQELTARTHHTGVTRKRLMPLVFDSSVANTIEPGTNITRDDGKNVGKFRNGVGMVGLGLIRFGDVKGQLGVTNRQGQVIPVKAHRPGWWPEDINFK